MLITDDRERHSPADLTAHLACGHLSLQRREVARGKRERAYTEDAHADLIRAKGLEHERAYRASLDARGVEVVEIELGERPGPDDWERAAEQTREAMRRGAEVIYQATFLTDRGVGQADFIERVELPTELGAWGYEAIDTKLARAEKPDYALQLCFYSEAIEAIQGRRPQEMHVVLGTNERRSLQVAAFDAYYRRARERYLQEIEGAATEPYPCDHCSLCDYRNECNAWWKERDHLSRVADIRRGQVDLLIDSGVTTLTALSDRTEPVEHLDDETLAHLRTQARLQRESARRGEIVFELRPFEQERGFALLPPADRGDLFIDLEGDPLWEPARDLTFLFGIHSAAGYEAIWAHDRREEQRLLEAVVDRIVAARAAHPGMHVYHYGVPEPAAIKRLAGEYGTREEEVDDLLRHRVFVDLHSVIKQSMVVGVERYGLKQIEPLVGFDRTADVGSGTQAVLAYERWRADREQSDLDEIAAYNDEDCRATEVVRDWLLGVRPDDAPAYVVPERKEKKEDEKDAARLELRTRLTANGDPDSPPWIAGHLMGYHQREARPGWWTYFERLERMTPVELLADSECLGALKPAAGVAPYAEKRSTVYTLEYPPQNHKLSPGKRVEDPATKKSAGTIVSVDDMTGRVEIKRGPSLDEVRLPISLIPEGPLNNAAQRGAVERIARCIADGEDGFAAARQILERAVPRISGRAEGDALQTNDIEKLQRIAADLEESYLFIQGPPGSGKTYTGARLAVELMTRGRRVGIAAPGHAAIHNLLDEILVAAEERGLSFEGLKKSSGGSPGSTYDRGPITSCDDNKRFEDLPDRILLVAGTAWLFSRPGMQESIDTLLIDEAGQVSLADALAMGTSARNLLLLGDPCQLAQVSQGSHPPGTGHSVLDHLLGEDLTVPPERGIFIEQTRRMHPSIGEFISDVVYGGRLSWVEEVEAQSTEFGTGLRFVPCEHRGNTSSSVEEAELVASKIREQIGGSFVGKGGRKGALAPTDFMVVAPYNAQVRKMREALAAVGLDDVPVGTVDKFQGQEAPIVYFSMATSTGGDIPRSLEFLFSKNRLNVAISRARCLVHLVCCPELLDTRPRTIEQMELVNVLCRFVEKGTDLFSGDRSAPSRPSIGK